MGHEFTRFAFSFVHDGAEADLLRPLTGARVVAAKIEFPEAMANLEAIAERFDELWLCRGDLGAQAGLAALGPLQEVFAPHPGSGSRATSRAGARAHDALPPADPGGGGGAYQAERDGFAGIVLSGRDGRGEEPPGGGAPPAQPPRREGAR